MRSSATRTCLLTVLAVLALASPGCVQPTLSENPAQVAVTDLDLVRKTVADVLVNMDFEVEVPPRTPERIDTAPLVSAYPAEFWRKDTPTDYDRTESTLHTVRRTVTVHMRPAETRTEIEVEVRKERPSLPEGLDAKTANESYTVFRRERRALEAFEEHYGKGLTWQDYGRDSVLEREILTEILSRL